MTLSTTFVNKTTVDFKLKEGNAGVYREVTVLKGLKTENAVPSDENKCVVEFDEKATYREYRTVSRPGGQKIQITSDFCLDNSVINIEQVAGNNGSPAYKCTGERRLGSQSPRPWPFNFFGAFTRPFSKKA